MATVKAVLPKQKKKADGTFPLYLRICEKQKVKFISIGYSILKEDWDEKRQQVKKTSKDADVINAILRRKEIMIDKQSLKVVIEDTGRTVIEELNQTQKRNEFNDFFKLSDVFHKEQEKLGKFARLVTDKSRVGRIKLFAGKSELKFEEIDVNFLRNLRIWLKTEYDCSERTVTNYMVGIRTIFNRAIQEKIVKHEHYPFGKRGIQIKFHESAKIGLNEEEVRQIENLNLSEEPHLNHTKNVWLFSFYLAGIRISDVCRMKWSDVVGNRLVYTMGKNGKVVSLKIPDKAVAILAKYQSPEKNRNAYIFPELETVNSEDLRAVYVKINISCHRHNTNLKEIAERLGITKKLTCHIARHTFGNITGDKISPQMLQKLYRHTDIKTSMGYQANFIHTDVDDALESVLNF